MCVGDAELRDGMNLGLEAIREEVARSGTEVDQECLAYVLDMEAGSSDEALTLTMVKRCTRAASSPKKRRRGEHRRVDAATWSAIIDFQSPVYSCPTKPTQINGCE